MQRNKKKNVISTENLTKEVKKGKIKEKMAQHILFLFVIKVITLKQIFTIL